MGAPPFAAGAAQEAVIAFEVVNPAVADGLWGALGVPIVVGGTVTVGNVVGVGVWPGTGGDVAGVGVWPGVDVVLVTLGVVAFVVAVVGLATTVWTGAVGAVVA